MSMLVPLSSAEDRRLCGGKAASLARWRRLGFQVPDGIVVTTLALQCMMAQNPRLADLDRQITMGIASVAIREEMRRLILDLPFPHALKEELSAKFQRMDFDLGVAVRSSGVAEDGDMNSHAGIYDSFLGVEAEDVMTAVRKVWASAYTERSSSYRNERGIKTPISAQAVLVQEMVDGCVSGVTFTQNPTDFGSGHLLVEMCWGLGESLVSGIITPERVLVDRATLGVVERTDGRQTSEIRLSGQRHIRMPHRSKLSENTLFNLVQMCMEIERYAGFPCDIEWTVADGGIWLLQVRPITSITP